jgi:hypothetical protein
MTFDLRTHKRNSKGVITRVEPYRLFIKDGAQRFERPPGSGYFYAANGELIEGPVKDVKLADKPVEQMLKEVDSKASVKTKEK